MVSGLRNVFAHHTNNDYILKMASEGQSDLAGKAH